MKPSEAEGEDAIIARERQDRIADRRAALRQAAVNGPDKRRVRTGASTHTDVPM